MPDLKITQLTEETSPVGADLMAIVDDVAGTPVTKKCTLTNLATLMGTLAPGGDSTFTSAHASPPATPGSGDIWLPSDSFYAYRYSGSLWVPWGPIFPMTTPPAVSGFTWVNQGSSVAVETNGGIFLNAFPSATHSVRALVKAIPATPYIVNAAFLIANPLVNFLQSGLIFRQSGDGKCVAFSISTGTGASAFEVVNFDSPTSANSTAASLTVPAPSYGAVIWISIADDGTNRIYSWSADGRNWVFLASTARTTFLTADQIGIFCNSINASWGCNITLISWEIVAGTRTYLF